MNLNTRMVQAKAAMEAGLWGNTLHTSAEDKRPSGNTWSTSLKLTVAIMAERCCSRYLDARGNACTVCILNVGQEYSQPVLILPTKLFTGGCFCDPHLTSVCDIPWLQDSVNSLMVIRLFLEYKHTVKSIAKSTNHTFYQSLVCLTNL